MKTQTANKTQNKLKQRTEWEVMLLKTLNYFTATGVKSITILLLTLEQISIHRTLTQDTEPRNQPCVKRPLIFDKVCTLWPCKAVRKGGSCDGQRRADKGEIARDIDKGKIQSQSYLPPHMAVRCTQCLSVESKMIKPLEDNKTEYLVIPWVGEDFLRQCGGSE